MLSKYFIHNILILAFICGVFSQMTDGMLVYNRWRTINQRVFLNDDQQIYRQAVFLDNLKKINEHNADPSNTYQMALTQFTDMTEEEFQQTVLLEEEASFSREEKDIRYSIKPNQNFDELDLDNFSRFVIPTTKDETDDDPKESLASSIDWRAKGAVVGIKNQGQCGSCWAFSASAAMESFNYLRNKTLKSLSEQQIVDCASKAYGYDSNGCKGGYKQEGFYYATKYGILQSYQYPYTAVQGKCKVFVPTSGFYLKFYFKLGKSVKNLKTALSIQPIAVSVDASKWGQYGSGVFNGCSSSVKINHAVLAVGYDTSGNWIIKNSWGTGWGESGYMRLKAGDQCGITQRGYLIVA